MPEMMMTKAPSQETSGASVAASSTYGRYTFSLDTMKKRLPRPVFEALQATIRAGDPLDAGIADAVAGAMKDWALELGATHFTHWFQPLTGATAEKHDAFLTIGDDGPPIESFSGSQLIQAEPDASSFPSGGMRSTFEARGYTAWDPTSPAFILFHEGGATLTIPSVFVSYTGEALDKKTPLLRSNRELSRAAVRALTLMGRATRRVHPTLGAEQEYFLVRRDYYNERPDLQVTGRTVIGAQPPKGQQLEDNYFGAIDRRALDFMSEVEAEAWQLGIPIKTRHNEVAPHQYEAAPIFSAAHVATDQNQILMDLMRRVARRRGLAVLFHEKPFAGVNGSGKHCNWSMSVDAGANLLEPGSTPEETVQFLYFLTAVLRAVHRRARLLRASIANAGNDHRLGANEAPPAIISVFLGAKITDTLETLAEGRPAELVSDATFQTGLETLPSIKLDNTDRNRTSPFAFTGNKFEFRAVGASQSLAMPVTYLNVAVAEALDEMNADLAARIEAGEELQAALLAVVQQVYAGAKAVVFNGNNYGEEWHEEAARRGLPNEKDTRAALRVFEDEDTGEFLKGYNVFQPHELKARHHIELEKYSRSIRIEAIQMLRLAKTGVLPTAQAQQSGWAEAVTAAEAHGFSADAQKTELGRYVEAHNELQDGINAVREALATLPEGETDPAHIDHLADRLIPAMARLREACDTLERRTDATIWPFPTYHEILFQ